MATEKTSGKKAGDALLKKSSAEERKVDARKVEPAKAVPSLQERSALRNVRKVPTEKAREQSSAQVGRKILTRPPWPHPAKLLDA
jgi:hypothetical protein